MPDPILLPQPLSEPEAPDEPMYAQRFSGPALLPLLPLLLLIPLVLRVVNRDGIYAVEASMDRETLPRLPKVFKVHDFLDILSAIEPHFNGYRQEFVNALMGIMDVHASVKSLRQNWGRYTQNTAQASQRTGPDPVSIFRSLVPYMTDDIRYPTERYINIIGTIQGMIQQWRSAGGLFPQSGDGANPLMQILSALAPGTENIVQAMNLYQTMRSPDERQSDAPGHDEGTSRNEQRDTRGSLARLMELAKEIGIGRGANPGAADLGRLLSRLKTT
jgi:hypothetical protein